MCGIVGIYLKTKKYEKHLGKFLSGMLDGMATRGPDSAGFAIYTKENKNITVDLVNNTKNKDISKINLSTNEKHLYNKVVGHNKEGNSINKDVATLLKTGKKGVESIERIAKALKDNKEPLNAYKMAVSRFYKDMPKVVICV